MLRRVDLRFIEIGYELMMLQQYVELLEANLPAIIETEKKCVWKDLDRDDDADRSTGWHLEQRLEEGVTTRFLTAAVIMGAWAVYEASVEKLASHIQRQKEVSLKMSQVRGGFLERARTYFDDVLRFDLHPPDTDWTRLERLSILRNLLAHANGRLWDVREDILRAARPWLQSTSGITVVDDEYLVVSSTFAKGSLAFIDEILRNLTDRVRDSF